MTSNMMATIMKDLGHSINSKELRMVIKISISLDLEIENNNSIFI